MSNTEFKRFNDKVCKTEKGCWEWTGAKFRGNYGHFRRKINGVWKMYKAHRYSYEVYKGTIPEGYFVCHKCDNPCCVNPDHLFIGTPKDNSNDMIKKGRQAQPRNPRHNWLSKEIAEKIRQDHKNGMSYKDLQIKYNTSKPQVCRVVLGHIWK